MRRTLSRLSLTAVAFATAAATALGAGSADAAGTYPWSTGRRQASASA